MTWTFEVDGPDGTVTAAIRNPEFSERTTEVRRQGKGVTEAGLVFVQDLGEQNEFIEGSWTWLTPAMRSALLLFFGPNGTLRQGRGFALTITGMNFPVVIGTGMVIDGVGLGTGQGYGTGQTVVPDTVVLDDVRLDQPDLSFAQQRNDRYSTELAFRIG